MLIVDVSHAICKAYVKIIIFKHLRTFSPIGFCECQSISVTSSCLKAFFCWNYVKYGESNLTLTSISWGLLEQRVCKWQCPYFFLTALQKQNVKVEDTWQSKSLHQRCISLQIAKLQPSYHCMSVPLCYFRSWKRAMQCNTI